MSIYTTKAMAKAMRQDKKAGTFLMDKFFGKVDPKIGKTVTIDIIKGKRRLAPFQTPRVEGELVEKQGHSTREYTPAYLKPKDELAATDVLDDRIAGDNEYSLTSPQEREAIALAAQLNDLEDMIIRREEWMCAQQLVNGYVDVVGKGVNYRIDLGMEASHKITVATVWSDVANATPFSDIGDAVALISKDAGISANTIIANSELIEEMLNTADMESKLNTRRMDLGQINPMQFGENATYYGDIVVKGKRLEIWSYDEWFLDENDVEQPMIPDGKVVVTSDNADFRRHYGAIKDKKAGWAAMPRFPKTWDQEDPSITWIMVQSAPLPAAHQIDAICVLSV